MDDFSLYLLFLYRSLKYAVLAPPLYAETAWCGLEDAWRGVCIAWNDLRLRFLKRKLAKLIERMTPEERASFEAQQAE